MERTKEKMKLSVKLAAITLMGIFSILLIGIIVLKLDMHVLLIIVLSILVIVSMTLGYSFDETLEFMKNSIFECIPVMMIFILIGAVIASWIIAGTVPAIIYYGLKYITAKWFLPFGLVLCSLTSLAIGTAWGTGATVGIALMGMGISLGIPAPLVAGMVISGSFFGDKMSAISDTASLAAAATGANLYAHLKSMLMTSVPSFIIAFIIYSLMGFKYANGVLDVEGISNILRTLENNFTISPLVFLPVVVLFAMNIKKVPAIPAMIMGTAVAGLVAVFYQGTDVKTVFEAINYGYAGSTGHEMVDSLLNRGGIQSMMWTFSLAFIAVALGGILDKVGFIKVIIGGFIKKVTNPGLLAMLVMGTTTFGTIAMGEVYLSLILSGNLFREDFKEKGYKPEMLSRFIEEGGTLTQVFIPWSTSGAFMSSTLGVATFAYSPFALINYINPLLSIVLSFLGIFVQREDKSIIRSKQEILEIEMEGEKL